MISRDPLQISDIPRMCSEICEILILSGCITTFGRFADFLVSVGFLATGMLGRVGNL